MPRAPTAFGEDAFGRRAETAARFFLLNLAFSTQAAYAAPLILLAQTRQVERDKESLDRLEAHREELLRHVEEREAAIKKETADLKLLLKANTTLTQEDKALTERVEGADTGDPRAAPLRVEQTTKARSLHAGMVSATSAPPSGAFDAVAVPP